MTSETPEIPAGDLVIDNQRRAHLVLPNTEPQLLGPASHYAWRPEEIDAGFYSFATMVLYGSDNILPSVRGDGFQGDPYFDKKDYQKLLNFVRQHCSEVTA